MLWRLAKRFGFPSAQHISNVKGIHKTTANSSLQVFDFAKGSNLREKHCIKCRKTFGGFMPRGADIRLQNVWKLKTTQHLKLASNLTKKWAKPSSGRRGSDFLHAESMRTRYWPIMEIVPCNCIYSQILPFFITQSTKSTKIIILNPIKKKK